MAQEKMKDKSQKPSEASAPAATTKEVVEFFGPGKEVTIRRMQESDWTAAGIEGLEETDWRQENNWTHDLSDFHGHITEVRDWVALQPDFRITEVALPEDEG